MPSIKAHDLTVSFDDSPSLALYAESTSEFFTKDDRRLQGHLHGDEATLKLSGWEAYTAHRISSTKKEN